jgi:hypothetical protein
MRNSRSINIDDLRRKGLLGVVTASKEEIFGLKGALLVTCRQSWAWFRCVEGSAKVNAQGIGKCKKTKEGRYPFVGSRNPAPLYSQASLYIMDFCELIAAVNSSAAS